MKTSDFGCEIEFFYTYKERQPQPGTLTKLKICNKVCIHVQFFSNLNAYIYVLFSNACSFEFKLM